MVQEALEMIRFRRVVVALVYPQHDGQVRVVGRAVITTRAAPALQVFGGLVPISE